ncbi:helicase-exonuclease AddAB subunit AddA [Clostridium sp.]|uniref:helicase-exonuclease AddAB subunit AddA n=1 Tax=Clostridium sp. TaxID=1506 RepID=UPI003F2A5C35
MAETKWTDEQLQSIITRECNLLVAAAAGSGKTAVLVERIIRIITNETHPVDIDRLLVVTFTSAAAAEMRERIAAAISKALEKNPNSRTLQRQLTLLSRSNITTMHSFCLDVIKNYFHTIDLDPSFRIADETENTLLKLEIVNEIFEQYYEDDNIEFKRLVEAYSGSRDDEKLKNIVLDLYRFSMSGPWPEKWLMDKAEEFNINSLEQLNNTEWVKILKENIYVEVTGYLKMLKKSVEIIKETDGLEPYLDVFLDDINSLENVYNSLEFGLEEIFRSLSSVSFGKLKAVKKNTVSDEEAQKTVKNIRDSVKKKINKLIEDSFSTSPEESLDAIRRVYPYMKMLSTVALEFSRRFAEKKKERNLLDFNDLEHLCLKILIEVDEEGNIHPSSVAKEFREYFDEVLVDEYQDSNNVQETIIDLVSRKSLDNPNVFMVGDVKQSIYRFRQAKPELFLDKYNRYPMTKGGKDRKIQLYKNFRSRKEVIEGVNYIFKKVMSETVGELEYTDEEALNLGASYKINDDEATITAGPIELHILEKDGSKSNSFEEEFEASEEEEEEELDSITLEARIVANRINQLLNPTDGKIFKVIDKGTGEYRPLRYKDIVILLRATKNWSEIFLDELGYAGIPVYADTGSGYFESIEIRTIMSLLKIIDNPMQDVPMISVLRSPIVGFSANDLADIRLLNKEKYFYEIIEDVANNEYEVQEDLKEKCVNIIDNIKAWRKKSLYMPIDEFIWGIYMETAYYGYVGAMPNGKLRQANLKILFQRAKQYEQTSFKGLFNFINFINKLRKSSGDMGSAKILGENEDVVRIMSIHKSKGLEFPVVFTSGAGKQFNLMDLNNSILYHDDLGFGPEYVDLEKRNSYTTLPKEAIKKRIRLETLSEEMRILYVAFTRAKEKLIITGATRNLEKTISSWASAAALDSEIILPSEVLKGKSYLDWIGMAMCKHRDGEALREYVGASNDLITNDFSTWNVQFWTKNLLTVDKKNEAVDKNEEKKLFITSEIQTVDKEIERRLAYKYKYKEAGSLPSNISVSDLKRAAYESEDDDVRTVKIFGDKEIIKPKFLQDKKGLSSAEKGTIMHYVMQKIDFNKVSHISEIKEQIDKMQKNEMLTEEEASSVKLMKIKLFFKSELGQRLLNAYKNGNLVQKELPFFTEVSSLELDKTLDENIYLDENIRLQGIIDCFFEESDGIVLLDYKTDYVEQGNEEKIIDRYRAQIKYYKDAIEKITNKKVKESYLYLFYLDKEIKVD